MIIQEADQGRPLKLMKNSFLHGRKYKEYLAIVKKNRPELSDAEIIDMFEELNEHGCSCADFANIIGIQYANDFEQKFGYSLISNGEVDYNKIEIDIMSRFYKTAKVNIFNYDNYEFSSAIEACSILFGQELVDENSAIVYLANNNIKPNGISESGKLKYINTLPRAEQYVGTPENIAKTRFGIEGIHTFDQLVDLGKKNGIKIDISECFIQQKLTGLLSNNFNFWSKYYMSLYGIDEAIEKKEIFIKDAINNYQEFQNLITEYLESGSSISVSAPLNSEVYMHTNKKFSWQNPSSKTAGHIMNLKGFDVNNDIIVSSYGETFYIPKEMYKLLEYHLFSKVNGITRNDR